MLYLVLALILLFTINIVASYTHLFMLGLLLPFAISCPLSWAWPPAGAPHPPELVAAETVYGEIGQMVSEY